ncbi:MAG: hypothetical protein PHV59_09920, partial [Victivallales bacterium]|nr:hypothetical protein [Victivallales bacterium]
IISGVEEIVKENEKDIDISRRGGASESFIDRLKLDRERIDVVNDFINQMMQPALAGVADIHAGTLADRLKALKHRYLVRTVFAVRGNCIFNIFRHQRVSRELD